MPRAGAAGNIAGLVLAGGRGARMGEIDKGLAPLRGVPLVEHVLRVLMPQVARLVVSANRNADSYSRYAPVLADDPAHGLWQGPLAGIAAGLAGSPLPWVATVPCDTPFLPGDLVARLALALALPADGAGGGTDGSGADGRPRIAVARAGGHRQSVCMLLPIDLLPSLRAYLDAGERKVDRWQDRHGCVEVAFDDEAAFMNLNTMAELARAQSLPPTGSRHWS
ncbi:molybdenum cofactor guanylyltransferase MobA [Achromobacter aloeverae]|uniref:Molybdenum cofactor guanylyltransferase n=1 Tax=Achromobacter aloeverae TaxID=1750518 RepID=A0A4Q1HEL6_9BURK|nr:molybdenum cofactor guanylyltransferase MobA [Achromobacter aloeverae]RXN84702.1 molybdenum cofactor guanylyltransferase [Achromobacter aloeverae]